MNYINADTMKKQGSNSADTAIIPRTLTKFALRTYFKLTYKRYRTKLVTEEIRKKLGIKNSRQDKGLREYDINQTKILIKELQLSNEELIAIGKLQE